jgi:hypothetical protein
METIKLHVVGAVDSAGAAAKGVSPGRHTLIRLEQGGIKPIQTPTFAPLRIGWT